MKAKDFSEYWAMVDKLHALPKMATQQLLYSLSPKVRQGLIRLKPEKAVSLLNSSLDQIYNGSMERIDSLVRKWL